MTDDMEYSVEAALQSMGLGPKGMSLEQWNQQRESKQRGEAIMVLNGVKAELAIRKDNEHVGTGMGGNCRELFFLLSNNTTGTVSYTDPKRIGWFKLSDGTIELRISPEQVDEVNRIKDKEEKSIARARRVRWARQELTRFIAASTVWTPPNLTDEQLASPSFVADLVNQHPTLDLKMMHKALTVISEFRAELEDKIQLLDTLNKLHSKETERLQNQFLKETGFTREEFDRDHSPLSSVFTNHPVFGEFAKRISAHYGEMTKRILSENDINNFKRVDAYPPYIRLWAIRNWIGIEVLVKLNLDEHMRKMELESECED